MTILLLGPSRPHLVKSLESFGDRVVTYNERITGVPEIVSGADFLISYGYRRIIKNEILSRFPRRAVNLHVSLLPWNRGVDPNLWSFLEDTPKGVTIHYLDAGVDTGEIIAQRAVEYTMDDTLRTTYERLTATIEKLFTELWPSIRSGTTTPIPQVAGGTFHLRKDKKRYEHLLRLGWDTPVRELIGRALGAEESLYG